MQAIRQECRSREPVQKSVGFRTELEYCNILFISMLCPRGFARKPNISIFFRGDSRASEFNMVAESPGSELRNHNQIDQMKIKSLKLIATLAFASFAMTYFSACSGLSSTSTQPDEAEVSEKRVGQGHWVRDERNRPKYVW